MILESLTTLTEEQENQPLKPRARLHRNRRNSRATQLVGFLSRFESEVVTTICNQVWKRA